jgi:hypothetical protein
MGHVCACSKNSKKSSNLDTAKKKQNGGKESYKFIRIFCSRLSTA